MSNREILYIEDNFHNRRIVRKILERQGYTLHEREDGLEGYEFLKELKPGVVLLDISLPSMDGMEIARRVKDDPEVQHIYLIALTASAMQGDRERFLDAGCDDYLSKPFRALDLVELVNKYAELVAANVPAPPPQPSELHETGPLEVKEAEVSPESVEMEAESQEEPEVEAVDEQGTIEAPQVEEAIEAAVEPETEQEISPVPEPPAAEAEPVIEAAEVEEVPVEPEIEEPVTETVELAVDEVELTATVAEEAEPAVEAVEALDETPTENAGVVEETQGAMESDAPAYVEPVAETADIEETPVVEEVEEEQAEPFMEEETTAMAAPAVEEEIQTAGLDQESIEAGLKKLEEESAEPLEQLATEEPSAELEPEIPPSSPAMVEDLTKKNGNLESNKQKNTEEIDAIKAGIMGVINPDNLRPVDPNNHRE
jgi:CheY-like chemotaxis protein